MSHDEESGFSRLFASFKSLFGARGTEPSRGESAFPAERRIEISEADRADLLHFARSAPLVYGCWGDLKRLYKEAERAQAMDILGALLARLDAIPFTKSLQFDMEIWHWEACKMDYAVATYWYAAPGATCNREPAQKEAAESLRGGPVGIKGAIDCETMKVMATSEKLAHSSKNATASIR